MLPQRLLSYWRRHMRSEAYSGAAYHVLQNIFHPWESEGDSGTALSKKERSGTCRGSKLADIPAINTHVVNGVISGGPPYGPSNNTGTWQVPFSRTRFLRVEVKPSLTLMMNMSSLSLSLSRVEIVKGCDCVGLRVGKARNMCCPARHPKGICRLTVSRRESSLSISNSPGMSLGLMKLFTT